MKKLLLILLCLPLVYSCGDKEKIKKLEDRITELEKKENIDNGSFYKENRLKSYFKINDNLYRRRSHLSRRQWNFKIDEKDRKEEIEDVPQTIQEPPPPPPDNAPPPPPPPDRIDIEEDDVEIEEEK